MCMENYQGILQIKGLVLEQGRVEHEAKSSPALCSLCRKLRPSSGAQSAFSQGQFVRLMLLHEHGLLILLSLDSFQAQGT